MSTTNATNKAATASNRSNADVKSLTAQIAALNQTAKERIDTTAGDTAAAEIVTQITALNAQADIVYPVTDLEPAGIEIVSGVVEDAAPTAIVMQLNQPGDITDETGFTISGSTAATSISAAAVVGGVLTLTANGAVANGETVLISYNGATGNLVNDNNAGDAAGSITDMEVTNNVA